MATRDSKQRPIVVKRQQVVEGAGGHGGAWKVAYADFVTAMMAFFLVMWLLNTTTPEQRQGLAVYFSPNNMLAVTRAGSGRPFGGKTPYDDGELVSDRGAQTLFPGLAPSNPDAAENDSDSATVMAANGSQATATVSAGPADEAGGAQITVASLPAGASAAAVPVVATSPTADGAAAVRQQQQGQGAPAPEQQRAEQRLAQEREEERGLARAAEQIREAVRDDPNLAPLARQLVVEQTPEGMRIQILDEERQPMFATGSATLNERAHALVAKIAPVLVRLPNGIAITGHTDAAPYHGTDKTNWDLSSERANATRRLLVEAGLPEARLHSVAGNADRDLLLPNDPLAAANRRISILVLRSTEP